MLRAKVENIDAERMLICVGTSKEIRQLCLAFRRRISGSARALEIVNNSKSSIFWTQ